MALGLLSSLCHMHLKRVGKKPVLFLMEHLMGRFGSVVIPKRSQF
jgi:hypothetical protein